MTATSAVDPNDYIDPFMSVEMESEAVGIPSEIIVIAPTIPDISIVHNIPTSISIEVPKIPDIKIIGPSIAIPHEIRVYTESVIPETIRIVSEMPSTIKLDTSTMPTSIKVDMPERIFVDSNIPSIIQVEGMPSSIEIKGYIPSEIIVKLEENIQIPLVYSGGPIPVQFDFKTPSGMTGEQICFALTPCNK